MIFGIYGPHCVGKTTFLERFERSGIRKVYGDVIQINIDNIPEFPHSKYYRTVPGKTQLLTYAIRDISTLWIIEGCRFWGGMWSHIRPVLDDYGGGLFVLIVTCTAEFMGKALRERAILNQKAYHEDYWTIDRLEYEAERRALNSAAANLYSHEWGHLQFLGDYSMWDKDPTLLINHFSEDRDLWYIREPYNIASGGRPPKGIPVRMVDRRMSV